MGYSQTLASAAALPVEIDLDNSSEAIASPDLLEALDIHRIVERAGIDLMLRDNVPLDVTGLFVWPDRLEVRIAVTAREVPGDCVCAIMPRGLWSFYLGNALLASGNTPAKLVVGSLRNDPAVCDNALIAAYFHEIVAAAISLQANDDARRCAR